MRRVLAAIAAAAAAAAWPAARAAPPLRVAILNYDAPDERWPLRLKSSFERYVGGGGGLVVVHAADNAFPRWQAYNEMIGVGGWRNRTETAGPFWYMKDGRVVS